MAINIDSGLIIRKGGANSVVVAGAMPHIAMAANR